MFRELGLILEPGTGGLAWDCAFFFFGWTDLLFGVPTLTGSRLVTVCVASEGFATAAYF